MTLAKWAVTLAQGAQEIFGFLKLDIAKNTVFPGPDHNVSENREKFHQRCVGNLGPHVWQELVWADNGGAFVSLIDQGSDYDRMVMGALEFLESLRLFNATKTLNSLFTPVHIRVSCHKREASWDPDLNTFFGSVASDFPKSEQDIGTEDSVALTEEVYEQISDPFKKMFTPLENHSYEVSGRPYERAMYIVRARAWSVLPSSPLSHAVPEHILSAWEYDARAHPESHKRITAAHAVWSIRPDRALPLLEDARKDLDEEVRKHATALLEYY